MKSAIFGDIRSRRVPPLKERADAVGSFPSHFYLFSIQFLCITTRSLMTFQVFFSLCSVTSLLHAACSTAAADGPPPHDDRQLAFILTHENSERDHQPYNENPTTKADFRPSPLLIQIYRLPPLLCLSISL